MHFPSPLSLSQYSDDINTYLVEIRIIFSLFSDGPGRTAGYAGRPTTLIDEQPASNAFSSDKSHDFIPERLRYAAAAAARGTGVEGRTCVYLLCLAVAQRRCVRKESGG